MIYFLRRADGAIKIGTTENYYARRTALKAEFGDLELLDVRDGGRDVERLLHQQFSKERITNIHKTEWFLPSQELLNYISEHTTKEIQTTKDITIRLSDRTYTILKSFQIRHFVKTGDHLSNDAAINLAVHIAELRATNPGHDLSHESPRE